MKRFPIQRIGPGCGDSIVGVHRCSFPKEVVELTIVDSIGASRYFEQLLAFPDLQPGHLFLGSVDGKRLIGYAHFRRLHKFWHLNNVAVLPEYAGTGIGTGLLHGWEDEAQRRGLTGLSLDVDPKNTVALEWYRRRGFSEVSRKWTFRRPLHSPSECSNFKLELEGWDAAEAWQAFYGFSTFGIRCGDDTWEIGRLGEGFFRVNGMLPRWLESLLSHVGPGRDLLTISSSQTSEGAGAFVSEAVRMEMGLDR